MYMIITHWFYKNIVFRVLNFELCSFVRMWICIIATIYIKLKINILKKLSSLFVTRWSRLFIWYYIILYYIILYYKLTLFFCFTRFLFWITNRVPKNNLSWLFINTLTWTSQNQKGYELKLIQKKNFFCQKCAENWNLDINVFINNNRIKKGE